MVELGDKMTTETLHTKFGTARVIGGYYKITGGGKENNGKLLHRLIFEDFYNIKLPSDIDVHHNDGDKLNNEIWNLIPLPRAEHLRIHNTGENNNMYGKKHSDETKKKMSEQMMGEKHHMYGKHFSEEHRKNLSKSLNKTGFFRVTQEKNKGCKKGFIWVYSYYTKRGERQSRISSTSLHRLKERVLAKGLEWFIIDEEKAKRSLAL